MRIARIVASPLLLLSSMLLPSRGGFRIVTDSRISPNRDTETHRSVAALSVGQCVDGVVFGTMLGACRADAMGSNQVTSLPVVCAWCQHRRLGSDEWSRCSPNLWLSQARCAHCVGPKQFDRQRLVHFVAVWSVSVETALLMHQSADRPKAY